MKTIRYGLFLALLSGGSLLAADAENPVEAKLREGLRNTMLQLRDAQAQMATYQAAQIEAEQKVKELTAKVESLSKQSIADRNTAANMVAELNAKLAEQDAVIQALQAANMKWKKSYGEITTLAQKKEDARGVLAAKVIKLERQVADQQTRNVKIFQVGEEILDRYEKFGLGDALLAREPFVGATRVKFQTLIQDYHDKLVDARIRPEGSGQAEPPATVEQAQANQPAQAQAR